MNYAGFTPIEDEETDLATPPEEALPQPEVVQQESPPPSTTQQAKPGFTAIEEDAPAKRQEEVQKEPLGLIGAFKKGIKESVTGELEQVAFGSIPEKDRSLVEDPTFFEGVVQSFGTLVGDFPYIMAGGALGSLIGAAAGTTVSPGAGSAIGAVAGSGTGALALPAFLKESMRQYRDFQDRGNDLTFGEFLERADQVAGRTLSEGSLGLALSAVQRVIPLAQNVPSLNKLFNTKYAGKPLMKAAEVGLETATATALPAISQGRLPSLEDVAQAGLLFAGLRLGQLPLQLPEIITNYKNSALNLALAERIQGENLAYPPLPEFKGENVLYKNSLELDRNIAAFDESFVNNITDKIDSISPVDLQSTHDAGTLLRTMLINPNAIAIESPVSTPASSATPRPVVTPVPLVENPIQQGINTLSSRTFRSDAEVGRTIQRQFQANREAERGPLRERYENLADNVQGVEVMDAQLHQTANDFVQRFEGSVTPATPEATLLTKARALRDMLVEYGEDGQVTGYRGVPLADIMVTNRSIKKVSKWDVQPDIRTNLNELTRATDEYIAAHLEEISPEVAQEYRQLNADYAGYKQRYDNRDTQPLFNRAEKGESIYNKYTRLDDFNRLTHALETTPEGQALLNDLRREVWQKTLGREVLGARTEAEFGKGLQKLSDRDFNNLMEYLEPRQQADMVNAIQRGNQVRQAAERAAEAHTQALRQHELDRLQNRETQRQARGVQDRQSLLVGLLEEDPAKLVQNVRTIEGINRTREALSRVPGGNEAMNALAKFETNDMLRFMGEGYIRSGRVPYRELSSKLKTNKDFRAKLEALNGPDFVRSLEDLIGITDRLSDSFLKSKQKYREDPITNASATNIAVALGIYTGNFAPAIAVRGAEYVLKKNITNRFNLWTEKANYDQAHIQQALDAARALESGNKAKIRRYGTAFNHEPIPRPSNPTGQ